MTGNDRQRSLLAGEKKGSKRVGARLYRSRVETWTMRRRNDGRRAQDSRGLALYQGEPGNDRSSDRGRPMNKLGGEKGRYDQFHRFTGPFIDSQDNTLHRAFHRFATRILPKPRRRSPSLRYPSPRYRRSAPRRYSPWPPKQVDPRRHRTSRSLSRRLRGA